MNIALTFTPQWPSYVRAQRQAFDNMCSNVAQHVVAWAFEQPMVQHAFVASISCKTPIGKALNDQIDDRASSDREVEADDVKHLDRYIEDAIGYALSNMEVGADSVKNLDEAVSEIISEDRDLVNTLVQQTIEKIAENLSR